MITIVYYQKYDSTYSAKSEGHEEAIVEEGMLAVTENIHTAFKKIIEHLEENPEEDIDYNVQLWLAEENILALTIGPGVSIEEILQEKELLLEEIKNLLH